MHIILHVVMLLHASGNMLIFLYVYQYSLKIFSYNLKLNLRYNKIKSWDICLPPSRITTHYNTRAMREFLINQVNEFVLKGII